MKSFFFKERRYPAALTNPRISEVVGSIGGICTVESFSGSAAIPCPEIENLRKIPSGTNSLHFDEFNMSPYLTNRARSRSNREGSSSNESAQTEISFRRPAVEDLNGSKTSSIRDWKEAVMNWS